VTSYNSGFSPQSPFAIDPLADEGSTAGISIAQNDVAAIFYLDSLLPMHLPLTYRWRLSRDLFVDGKCAILCIALFPLHADLPVVVLDYGTCSVCAKPQTEPNIDTIFWVSWILFLVGKYPLSRVKASSLELEYRCASIQKGERLLTRRPVRSMPGRRQRLPTGCESTGLRAETVHAIAR
jgi:hypothetical protein